MTNKSQKMFNVEPSLYLIEAHSTLNELFSTKYLENNAKDER